jgi:hypothetical protein
MLFVSKSEVEVESFNNNFFVQNSILLYKLHKTVYCRTKGFRAGRAQRLVLYLKERVRQHVFRNECNMLISCSFKQNPKKVFFVIVIFSHYRRIYH